jgi:hypothetical protein
MAKEYNDLTEDDYQHHSDDVDGKTIYFKVAETEVPQQEFSDLSEDDCEFIFQCLILADTLLKTHTTDKSLNNYSFEVLDTLIDQYNNESSNFDCTENAFINSIGAAFGHLINKQIATKWTVVSDEYGEDFACQISELNLTAFPLNSVAKAVEQNREGSLETIHLLLKRQKEELEKER